MKDEGLLVSNLIPYSFQLYSLQSFDYKNKKNEKTTNMYSGQYWLNRHSGS
jgi:hypothetical protein